MVAEVDSVVVAVVVSSAVAAVGPELVLPKVLIDVVSVVSGPVVEVVV